MDQLREYDDDYLRCREYHSLTPGDDGFHRFEKDGKFYFSYIDHGIVVFRSEGYAADKGRDNGIESVKKNMDDEENYKTIELPGGQWALSLRAQNAKEIARSCAEDTEEEALSYLPSARKVFAAEFLKLASVEAGSIPREDIEFEGNTHTSNVDSGDSSKGSKAASSSSNDIDDYMICREYQEKADVIDADEFGIVKFQHEINGEYYFAWVNSARKVLLRSEGYPSTSGRDNGAESVKKNREIKERFKVIESHGAYFMTLKAGNHQEIGRSCPSESEDALWALYNFDVAAPSEPVTAELPIVEEVAPVVVAPIVEEVKVPEVAAAAVAAAAISAAVSQAPASVEEKKIEYKEVDKADDYLACDEYKGYTIADKANNIAFFKHKNGQFYFAVYNKDGSVKLRSEGFKTAADRDQELRGVIKFLDDSKMYTSIERAGYTIRILKDKTGREVGRSCPEKIGAAPVAAPISVAAPIAVAAAATYVETPKVVEARPIVETVADVDTGGAAWWKWLLPLLLLAGLFFGWKSCQKTPDVDLSGPMPVDTTVVVAAPTPVDTVKAATPVVAAPDCNLNWILFDFDRYDIKDQANGELQTMAKILKDNPTYKGVLKAYTDARGTDDYNQNLSQNRANAAKSTLTSLGIDAARLTASANSETSPIAENTDDDSGRHFNRRVELYVQDANGKDVCKSIAPNVPSSLKK